MFAPVSWSYLSLIVIGETIRCFFILNKGTCTCAKTASQWLFWLIQIVRLFQGALILVTVLLCRWCMLLELSAILLVYDTEKRRCHCRPHDHLTWLNGGWIILFSSYMATCIIIIVLPLTLMHLCIDKGLSSSAPWACILRCSMKLVRFVCNAVMWCQRLVLTPLGLDHRFSWAKLLTIGFTF